jgi:diaminopimelate decarboxylase
LKLFLVNLSGGIGLPYNTERNFGKTAVVAKDTPAFIGNVLEFWYSKFIPFG